MKNNTFLNAACAVIFSAFILSTQSCKKEEVTPPNNNTATCNFTALGNDTYSYGTLSGTFNSHFNFVSGANWQMSARDANASPSTGIGIQFPEKPTADKNYNVVDYGSGQVSGADNVFVYVSQTPGGNDNGTAGGCLKVTINGGKITASFKDVTLASGKKLSATIVEQ